MSSQKTTTQFSIISKTNLSGLMSNPTKYSPSLFSIISPYLVVSVVPLFLLITNLMVRKHPNPYLLICFTAIFLYAIVFLITTNKKIIYLDEKILAIKKIYATNFSNAISMVLVGVVATTICFYFTTLMLEKL